MSYKRVVLKWENRFGKHRRIMKPHKAQIEILKNLIYNIYIK